MKENLLPLFYLSEFKHLFPSKTRRHSNLSSVFLLSKSSANTLINVISKFLILCLILGWWASIYSFVAYKTLLRFVFVCFVSTTGVLLDVGKSVRKIEFGDYCELDSSSFPESLRLENQAS